LGAGDRHFLARFFEAQFDTSSRSQYVAATSNLSIVLFLFVIYQTNFAMKVCSCGFCVCVLVAQYNGA
jgi:hypothetical protein